MPIICHLCSALWQYSWVFVKNKYSGYCKIENHSEIGFNKFIDVHGTARVWKTVWLYYIHDIPWEFTKCGFTRPWWLAVGNIDKNLFGNTVECQITD